MMDNSSFFETDPDIGISHHSPYSTNGTEVMKISGLLPFLMINYINNFHDVNYGSLRGLVSLAPLDNQLQISCTLDNSTEDIFIFSYLDFINGYPNNAYCFQSIEAHTGRQFTFWFKTFYMEEAYDNVTVQNVAQFDGMKMLPGHTYIAPSYDLSLHFYSDGSITQAGFEMVIQEYDCLSGNVTISIPCSATVNATFLENLPNSYVFCFFKGTYIHFKMDDKCPNETTFIALHYNITHNNITYATVVNFSESRYNLRYERTAIPPNYYIYVQGYQTFGITDITNISFSMTLYQIPTPKRVDNLILHETSTHIFYDLSKIPNNSYVEVQRNMSYDSKIDYYFVTDSDYGVLDFYEGYFNLYIAPIGQINNINGENKRRRFMPIGYTSYNLQSIIYNEKEEKNYSALMFVRPHNLNTQNCLFEHDVIDARLLVEENGKLTMVNNGTGDCIVTLLNPFQENQIYLDEFWTDSVSDPVEVHDENGLLFGFTKFNEIKQFFLKENFYQFILPPRTSFTVIGHENKLN